MDENQSHFVIHNQKNHSPQRAREDAEKIQGIEWVYLCVLCALGGE